MTQADLLELAQQGHPTAIAQLINQSLQPKGITATATVKGGCLQIILEAQLVPKQQVLANFIYQGALSLKADSITSLIVSGKKFSNSAPSWSQTFDLVSPDTDSSNPAKINRGIEQQRNPSNSSKTNISYRSQPVSRKPGSRKTPKPTIAETLSPEEECEQRLREIGRFPTQGKLSVSYYYAIPKLAKAALGLVNSSSEIIDAIAVRYRGELAALLLTDKYLALFWFPDFSQQAKKSFVFLFDRIDRVTMGTNGLVVYPKKYPMINIYFQIKNLDRKKIKQNLSNFLSLEKCRWIYPDRYEVSLNVFGVVVFMIALGVNLVTIYAIIQHIMTHLIGSGN